jgi:serine/threonine-protein kinase
MLSNRGDVKIIDFGIAKALDRVAGDTLSGKIKGKTLYMAPEHVRSEEIDRRIDIWAAGVILYQLVANRLPIRAQKDFELLRRLAANEEPKPMPPSVPPEVAAVALKALRPNREERYQTAGEMQRDIENALVATVGSVTAADVAAFTHQHIGDLIEAKRVAIAEALESAALRSQTGKHKAARDALASLPNLETEAVLARNIRLSDPNASDQEPAPSKSFTDLSSSLPYVEALGLAESGASPSSPAWRQWLRTPPGMAAIVGAGVALLVLTVSSVYAASSQGDVEPVRPLPFAALKSQVETKATKLATLVPSVPSQPTPPPVQESPPAASASATAKPSTTRTPSKTAPVKTKDPLSVFGTR